MQLVSDHPNRVLDAIALWAIADLEASQDRWPRPIAPPSWTVTGLMARFGVDGSGNHYEQMLRNKLNLAYRQGAVGKVIDDNGNLVRLNRAVCYSAPQAFNFSRWLPQIRMYRPS